VVLPTTNSSEHPIRIGASSVLCLAPFERLAPSSIRTLCLKLTQNGLLADWAFAGIGGSLPGNAVHGIHVAGLSPSLTSASLYPFPQTGPPLPSIADAYHRASRPIRNLDKMPTRAISGAQRCTWVGLTSLSSSRKYPPPQTFLRGPMLHKY
jgi:hypothetical protein